MLERVGGELVSEEQIYFFELGASLRLATLTLGGGTKIVLHEQPMHYHRHDTEIDVFVTGVTGVGITSNQLSPSVRSAFETFADARVTGGRKLSFHLNADFPYLHLSGSSSEDMSFVTGGGTRGLLEGQANFMVWKPGAREVTVYQGKGLKVSSPPSSLMQSLVFRFRKPTLDGVLKHVSESASASFFHGTQRVYRLR